MRIIAAGLAFTIGATLSIAGCGSGQTQAESTKCDSSSLSAARQTPVSLSRDGWGATRLLLEVRGHCDPSELSPAFSQNGFPIPSRSVANLLNDTAPTEAVAGDKLVFDVRWRRVGTEPTVLAMTVSGLSTTVEVPGWAGAVLEVSVPMLESAVPRHQGPVPATQETTP